MKNKASSTRKKVVIRRLDNGLIKGYVDADDFLGPSGVEVLDREGHLLTIPFNELKGVFFVRDFEGDSLRPERKVFHSRPKRSGLWVRLTFKDNDVMEGIVPNSLLELPPQGFLLTPPDPYSNNLRIFVPRNALSTLQIVGVIAGGGARPQSRGASRADEKLEQATTQISLFSSVTQSERSGS